MPQSFENNAVIRERFSIVMPVRNGGEYIKESVNSILSQSVRDFNLIILDNASTDDTVKWVRSLNDPRIIVYTNDQLLAIEHNWDRIKTVPRYKWMMIIGHDDIMYPNYLEVMAALVDKHPGASLYQCHFNFIDEEGSVTRDCKPMEEVQSYQDFFRETLENGGGFMMRSADYDAVGGIPLYPNLFFADFALWIELSRISYKATAVETCFSYRVHSKNTTATSPDEKYHAGFELFVNYLLTLKSRDENFRAVLNKHARKIIGLYCKGLSHRLLRTRFENRNHLKVSTLVRKYKGYADMLIDNNSFNPGAITSVWLAKIIDSTAVTRKLFLLFKKIFPKPILK